MPRAAASLALSLALCASAAAEHGAGTHAELLADGFVAANMPFLAGVGRRQLQATTANTRPDCTEVERPGTETCAECEDGLDNDRDGLADCDDKQDCQFTYYCKMRMANANQFNDIAAAWKMIWTVVAVCLLPLGVAAWAKFKDGQFIGQIKGSSGSGVLGRTQRVGVAGLGEGLTGSDPASPTGSIVATDTPAMKLAIGAAVTAVSLLPLRSL